MQMSIQSKEPTVREMLDEMDHQLLSVGSLPEQSEFGPLFDYTEFLEDEEFAEAFKPEYLM